MSTRDLPTSVVPWRHHRHRTARPHGIRRSGLSYIELIVASVSAGALMVGLSSVLYTSNQAFHAGDTSAGQRIKSAEVLGDVMHDLRYAISFSDRTANSVSFKVPDRDGNSIPETITYSWSGTAGDPLLYSVNGGTAAPIAHDVHGFNLSFVSHFMFSVQTPMGGSRLLFVVDNENSLTPYESARTTLLEDWGYEITHLSAADPQEEFDAALANHDVAMISADVSDVDLGAKLSDTTTGVASENTDLTDELGFADSSVYDTQDELRILTNNHYITEDFAVNSTVKLLDFPQSLAMLGSPSSADVHALGETLHVATYTPSLVTLEPGDSLQGGGEAKGRRVQLPWGAAALDDLTGDAVSILKRAVEWAGGAGANTPAKELLMIVVDAENLSGQELQRKAMLEAWGFKLAFVSAFETQAIIDDAVADADICYIHADIDDDELETKLRHAPIGVVCEANDLVDELGLRNSAGNFQNDIAEIDVVEKRHYMTQFFPLGSVQLFFDQQRMCKYGGNLGDALVLGNVGASNTPSLAVMETGSPMMGGYDEDPAPARRAFLPWGDVGFDIAQLTSDGRELFKRSLEWVGGAEADIPQVLFVVDDETSLDGDEADRMLILEGLGYFVIPISADASQSTFNTAMAESDVVFICDTIDPLMLGAKVAAAPIGVVSEKPESLNDLGISNGFTSYDDPFIEITNTSHYITETFATGPLEIYLGNEPSTYLDGAEASGKQTLGRHTLLAGDECLVAIPAGGELLGGGTAAGRRVKLPWGDGSDITELTAAGTTILERSMSWALGIGDDGVADAAPVNLGYEGIFASEQTGENLQVAMQVTLPEDGMFTSITGYFYDKDKKLRFAIYTDNGGEPDNLVTESEDVGPGGNGPQWTTLELPPVQLPAGTYWIAFGIDADSEKYYYQADAGQPVRYKNHDPVSGGFLTSWGASDASLSRKISLYGTYIPAN